MEAPGYFHPFFPGCNSHGRADSNGGNYQWPGFSVNGPFFRKAPSHRREPELGEEGAAGERVSKIFQSSNEQRTTPFVQEAAPFEYQNPWTGGCEGHQHSGGRGFHPGQRGWYGMGPMSWFGPWGNFGSTMGFRPWGGFGPWSNCLPFWGNPRFTSSFIPSNTMGPWDRFGPINCFGNNEYASRKEAGPEFYIFETPTSFVVCISLFGANKAGLRVELDSRKCELGIRGTLQRREEWPFLKGLGQNGKGEFEHKLYLGPRVNQTQIQIDGITARMENVILVVSIPKVNYEHGDIKKVHIE
ncbi:hypothetical protein PISL3812_09062 [Talaromyces islandicus]|uniref:SHSP domain-containing protein n=1 Tax=Talaromyces islandicus TaxID=28573 RepID=A0A0U1M8Y0_TALIS|nr:hypothetical protein PISL3812_09062 [Talaromyces islandicus]